MLLLKNGQIIDLENNKIVSKDILIDKGKIIKIDKNISCDCRAENLNGAYVSPAFIDVSTQLGLIESGKKVEGDDSNETFEEVISGMKTSYGIYPYDIAIDEAFEAGIFTAVVNSGNHNVVGAQSSLINTFNKNIINDCIDIKATLGDSPKKWNFDVRKSPLSRMGVMDILRKSLINARDCIENKNKLSNDMHINSLFKVLRKEIPLKIYANKEQDILSAISIKNEFDINIILDSGVEAYRLIQELEDFNIPVIVSSCMIDTSSAELENSKRYLAKMLSGFGILTAISTHHPTLSSELLPLSAGLMIREGMDKLEALKLITLNPAKIYGLNMGVIKKGAIANLIVTDKWPLYTMSKILLKVAEGNLI